MNVLCPYCGKQQAFPNTPAICTNTACGREVPRNYIVNARKRPPVWMVTVGYSNHGKSTFVDSLTTTIEKLGKISSGTVFTYLDEDTRRKVLEIRRQEPQGVLAESTQRSGNRPTPLLISLPRFLGNDPNTLIIYDLPGETFDNPDEVERYADVISYADTIWFLISLHDMERDQEGRSIADLVRVYVDGLERLEAKIKGRRVLVTYTKADLIRDRLPESLQDYLADDKYANLARMTMQEAGAAPFDQYDYQVGMHRASEQLKEYTYGQVPGGDALIALIEYYGMELAFSAVSSVPGADGRTVGTAQPRFRVLDPLIWALTGNNRATPDKELALIIDTGSDSSAVWESQSPQTFFDLLQSQSNMAVRTFFTGQLAPIRGVRPERPPRKTGLRMIGPILDSLPPGALALVIVNAPIDDLMDFYFSTWHDRLYVVCLKDLSLDWPHRVILNDDDNPPEEVVSQFLELATPSRT